MMDPTSTPMRMAIRHDLAEIRANWVGFLVIGIVMIAPRLVPDRLTLDRHADGRLGAQHCPDPQRHRRVHRRVLGSSLERLLSRLARGGALHRDRHSDLRPARRRR